MKIILLASYMPSLINFRGDLIKEMICRGHVVITCAPQEKEKNNQYEIELNKLGAKYIPVDLQRTGRNPVRDIQCYFHLKKLFKQECPDLVLSYTIKPNIYGSLAAKAVGIKKIYSIMTGAGSVFLGKSIQLRLLKLFLCYLYRRAFKYNKDVFFLNKDDSNMFEDLKILEHNKIHIINGSGVNLERFMPCPLKNRNTFLFIGRLIRDKGIFDFISAASIAKQKRSDMNFLILGPLDTNPSAITKEDLQKWINQGVVEYLGEVNDVRPYIARSFVLVLPSYREGQGRVLVEAMAIGRAVIATDVPGCRQTVDNYINGLLVPAQNADLLAEKMIWMYDNPEKTEKMGQQGIRKCRKKYDVKKINKRILKTMSL